MPAPALDDRVTAGLAALDRHAWQEAHDLLRAADADSALGGAELEQLGLAGVELSDRRSVTLKGIREPVEVAAIAWR